MIKKFSSHKIKIWFEPMVFSVFFYGFVLFVRRAGLEPAMPDGRRIYSPLE